MIYARQSTAIIVTVGPVLNASGVAVTDGVVGDFKISKNGGAPAALNGSATLTHRNTGHYSLSLTASDVGTVGTVEIVIDDTTNACPPKEIQVVEEAVYDMLFAASALGYIANQPVDLNTIKTQTVSCMSAVTVYPAVGTTATTKSNIEIVYETDFATNYSTTADRWITEVASIQNDVINSDALSSFAVAEIADGVWDELLSGHAISGSAGEALSAAGTAGDPWTTALPGAYGAGTAGYIIGTNLNGTITSRMASYTQPAGFLAATFPTTVASTTNITSASGIAVSSIGTNVITAASIATDAVTEIQSGLATATDLATVAGYLDTEIAAILADTNELQTDWANGGRLDLILDARASQTSVDTIDGIVDSILVDTAEIGTAGAGLTNINLPNQTMDIVGNITGNLSGSVGSVTGNVGGNVTGSVGSISGITFPSNFAALGINASGHVSRVTLADTLTTYTGNTVQTGDAYARIGANGASLSAIPWNAAWDAEVQSEVTDALTTALAEGYRATGAAGSVRDVLYEMLAILVNSSITSTTMTTKKLDQSTTAKTYTLDSATTPTAIEETT
jgi:hypothetical protein